MLCMYICKRGLEWAPQDVYAIDFRIFILSTYSVSFLIVLMWYVQVFLVSNITPSLPRFLGIFYFELGTMSPISLYLVLQCIPKLIIM